MPNSRKILIIDDDAELRDALGEQLSLYEEFQAVAAENGRLGVEAIEPLPMFCRSPSSACLPVANSVRSPAACSGRTHPQPLSPHLSSQAF